MGGTFWNQGCARSICPGWIETDMTKDAFPPGPAGQAALRKVTAAHPTGRLGRPADVAAMALWLAADDSRWITGQYFIVDGGLTAHAHVDPT